MRPLTDSEMAKCAAGWRRYKSEYETEPTHIWPFEHGFTAGLDTAAEQLVAQEDALGSCREAFEGLEAERDGLRTEVARLQKFAEATATAALKYENATWLVKKYPSNGRYQRQLKKIHDQLQEARRLVGDPQPTEF